MKTTKFLLAAGLVALITLTACSPAVTPLAKTAGESSKGSVTGTERGETNQVLVLQSITGDPRNTSGQVILFTFNVPVDEDTVASAFSFFKLANGANAYAAYTAEALDTPTYSVSGNVVAVTLNLTGASNPIEYRIKADVLKGYSTNGTFRLDPNGNDLAGETGEILIDTLTVGTNSAAGAAAPTGPTTGVIRSPYAPVFATADGYLSDGVVSDADYNKANIGTAFGISWSDTGSGATTNKVTVEDEAFQVFKNVDGVWTAQTVGVISSAALQNTILNLTALAGESYKIVFNPYYVIESEAVADYIHRASYRVTGDEQTFYVTMAKGSNNSATTPALADGASTVDSNGNGTDLHIDVTLAAGEFLDWSTVSSNSIKVQLTPATVRFLNGGAISDADSFVPVTAEKLETASGDLKDNNVNRFRLWLPSSLRGNGGTAFTGSVWFAPTVLTVNTNTAANDKLSFGNPSALYDGWRRVTF